MARSLAAKHPWRSMYNLVHSLILVYCRERVNEEGRRDVGSNTHQIKELPSNQRRIVGVKATAVHFACSVELLHAPLGSKRYRAGWQPTS